MTDIKPTFASNHNGETVADALNAHLGYLVGKWKDPFQVDIASAYFNPGGFGLLADALEQVGSVRLMLGAEPTATPARPRRLRDTTESAERAKVRRALDGHERDLDLDRDLLGFTIEEDAAAKRLIGWLESSVIEVRRFEEGFLHGKAFIVSTDHEGVISGSSNFTYAGLARNSELNLGHYDPHIVGQVADWFDELWEKADPFDLAGIYKERYEPHSPYVVYLKMLLERYGHELEVELTGDFGIHLTTFQQHGVERAERILDAKHGVLVADGVGLGKSYIAGELIRRTVTEQRQRVLVVAPASLRDGMWEKLLLRNGLGVEVVSYEQLASDARLNPKAKENHSALKFDLEEYSMIVVDEAHGVRNPQADRAGVLRRLLAGTPPKRFVMLTATPVNNSLWDLYHLLAYFIKNDAEFAPQGIVSLRDYFRHAMRLDPGTLSPGLLFDVLDAVAVRRTRSFVKKWYSNDTIDIDGMQVPISFPVPVVRRVDYELDDLLPGVFGRLAHALDCDEQECPDPDRKQRHPEATGHPVLSLARYGPTGFRTDLDALRRRDNQSDKAIEVRRKLASEGSLGGLLRSGLLKRFESSSAAFAATCRKMVASHEGFLSLLDQGKVATGEMLDRWAQADEDDLLDVFENPDELDSIEFYDGDALRAAVESDRDLLIAFAQEAETVTQRDDPKLQALVEQLDEIAAEADHEGIGPEDTRDKRKVIVFSYFADTAEWIRAHLEQVVADRPSLAAYRDRVTFVTGSEGSSKNALFGFAPVTTDAPGDHPDLYDVIVSTDVLAEGVNLQQARHIINYDLPWNPMRLVQRHGRIDRIGSKHKKVYLRCFYPTKSLDALLELEERLQRKITQAARSIGVEGGVLPGTESGPEIVFGTREEIERIRDEEAGLFEAAGERGHAHSGEEYRQELRKGLEDQQLHDKIRGLPWGSGSGLAKKGAGLEFVFCVRVGDHPEPLFRHVDLSGEEPAIRSETLTALASAHAAPADDRVLSNETHIQTYDAWRLARDHIFEAWEAATDFRKLLPAVPKAMRLVSEHLQEYKPQSIGKEQERAGAQKPMERLLSSIEAPYPNTIVKRFRDVLRDEGLTPIQKSEAFVDLIDELGLQPQPKIQPLPVITKEDIHLVCWQAIVGEEAT